MQDILLRFGARTTSGSSRRFTPGFGCTVNDAAGGSCGFSGLCCTASTDLSPVGLAWRYLGTRYCLGFLFHQCREEDDRGLDLRARRRMLQVEDTTNDAASWLPVYKTFQLVSNADSLVDAVTFLSLTRPLQIHPRSLEGQHH